MDMAFPFFIRSKCPLLKRRLIFVVSISYHNLSALSRIPLIYMLSLNEKECARLHTERTPCFFIQSFGVPVAKFPFIQNFAKRGLSSAATLYGAGGGGGGMGISLGL